MRALGLALALASALVLAQSTGPGGASSSGGSATSLVNVDAGTVFSPGDITAVGTLRTLGVAAANIVDAGTVVATAMRTVALDGGTGFFSGDLTSGGTIRQGGDAVLKTPGTVTATTIDLAAASASCVTAVQSTSGFGWSVTVGQSVGVAPSADDAAWDTGTLSAFVESADTIKIVYCGTGNPASMNYNLRVIR